MITTYNLNVKQGLRDNDEQNDERSQHEREIDEQGCCCHVDSEDRFDRSKHNDERDGRCPLRTVRK